MKLAAVALCFAPALKAALALDRKGKAIGKLQRTNFRKAFLAGAPMAFGTDGGVYPHGDNAKQFATMVEWGMKPIDAIRTATVEAARLMNLQGKAVRCR